MRTLLMFVVAPAQMVLLPWGWTTAKPDNYDDIYSLAKALCCPWDKLSQEETELNFHLWEKEYRS